MVGLSDECWLWTGAQDRKGYGNFTVARNKTNKAHIFSYYLHIGSIPKGLQVDHECNNPSCVNPYHLRLLTGTKNNERSNSPSAINKRKTHCCRGHEFSDENTKLYKSRRICIICEKAKERL